MCLASFFFSFMGGFAKLLGKSYSPLHITFFRNTIGLIPLLYSLYRRPPRKDNPKPFLLAFRGIAGTFVLFTLFYNLTNLPLGEAVTYVQASAFFIAIFSYWFLHEKLSKKGWLAVLGGFVGILLITGYKGSFEKFHVSGILNSLLNGLAYTSVRELKKYYDTRVIVLSFLAWGSLIPLLCMYTPLTQIPGIQAIYFSLPDVQITDVLLLILLALAALYGQIFMTKAYGEANAAILGVIGYSNIVFAVALGVVLGDNLPGILESLGMLVVICSGIVITREKPAH